MNFFEEQQVAKKRTTRLIALFIAAVVAIVLAVHFLTASVWYFSTSSSDETLVFQQSMDEFLLNPTIFFYTATTTLLLIGLSSFYKLCFLWAGGSRVAIKLGGRLLAADTPDFSERQLLNVVEEMSIASGIPVPPVYILEEDSINAFAAGNTIDDAVIGVTRGTINLLSRDELQGVIAHEFSHILHGDMTINIRLIGILHGILVLAIIGRIMVRMATDSSRRRSSSSNKKDGGALPLLVLGAGLMLIGWIGVLFGRLIKAAISRQREFLADASAVQYTRNPEGIAGALKKIGGWLSGSHIDHPRAEEASHMFFGNALGKSFTSLFATHPPLHERITKIDPRFTGVFPLIEKYNEQPEQIAGFSSGAPTSHQKPFPASPQPIQSSESITLTIGEVSQEHLIRSRELLGSIPPRVHQNTHSLLGAQAVTLALLIDNDAEVARKQYAIMEEQALPSLNALFASSHRALAAIPYLNQLRLPLIDLSLPSLIELSEKDRNRFLKLTRALVIADQRVTLFEYMLHHALKRHLKPPASSRSSTLSISEFQEYAHQLLSAAAEVVQQSSTDSSAEELYQSAKAKISTPLPESPVAINGKILEVTDRSLPALRNASWPQKQDLLTGLEEIILRDHAVTIQEAEFFRLIADALGCPVPPILKVASAA